MATLENDSIAEIPEKWASVARMATLEKDKIAKVETLER
jgi:hypothetical protein